MRVGRPGFQVLNTVTGDSPRRRMLGVLARRPGPHLPFFPKIYGPWLQRHGEEVSEETLPALLDTLHAGYMVACPSPVSIVRPCAQRKTHRTQERETEEIQTPCGPLRTVRKRTLDAAAFLPVEPLIKDVQDLERARTLYEGVTLEVDRTALARIEALRSRYARTALLFVLVPDSPLMQLLKRDIGLADTHYLLQDHPRELEGLLEDIRLEGLRVTQKLVDVLGERIDCYVSGEDTSTTLLSPSQFRRWCVPYLNRQSEIIHARGLVHLVHMCGYLKNLLPDMARLHADGFEALTTHPVGDVTNGEIAERLGDRIVIGGMNAALWLQHSAPDLIELIQRWRVQGILSRNLILSSGGEMPPLVPVAKIKEVSRFLWEWQS